jgi:negative regulator of flagellin synthesis FlgM
MRIDAFNSANEIATDQVKQQAGPRVSASAARPDSEDHSTFSSESVSLSSLTAKALQSPAVRQDKIDALRQAVSNGNYKIEAAKIASSMVDETA